VQLGHDDLRRRDAFFLVDIGRDAATIVLDTDRSVGVQGDQHAVAMPRQRLVDCIVAHLEHHVVEARSVVGIADVHARPFADCVEALQHLDAVGAIFVQVGGFCHATDIGIRAPKSTRAYACARAKPSLVEPNDRRRSEEVAVRMPFT
jgi:hypothetical protein